MEVIFKNRVGKRLFCRVNFPKNFSGPVNHFPPNLKFPAVILVHGFKGWSTQRHIEAIAKVLNAVGIITIRPDLTRNPGNSYLEFRDMTYKQELLDLEDVYLSFREMDRVHKKRIGIAGHSLGGMLVSELVSMHEEIKSLVTLSAVYDFRFLAKHLFNKDFSSVFGDFQQKGWSTVWSVSSGRELHIGKQFYEDVFARTADKFSSRINCQTLIISSEKDEAVSQSHADKYFKKLSSKTKKMEIIAGSDHNYTTGDSLDKVCELARDWFSKTLVNFT